MVATAQPSLHGWAEDQTPAAGPAGQQTQRAAPTACAQACRWAEGPLAAGPTCSAEENKMAPGDSH